MTTQMSPTELVLGMILVFTLTIVVRKLLGRVVEMPEKDPVAEAERLMGKGQFDAAERHLRRALEIDPHRQALVEKLQDVHKRRRAVAQNTDQSAK